MTGHRPEAANPAHLGSVIEGLPLDRLMSGPLYSMMAAQVHAARAYADFIAATRLDQQFSPADTAEPDRDGA